MVYSPAVDTVIEEALDPLLHNIEPVKSDAVNNEFSQLSTMDTVGADGMIFGAAFPLPATLVHPSTSWVTEYIPPDVTVIEAFVSPVLHNSEPLMLKAVSTELPQLSATETVGAGGVVFGAAVPLPVKLLQPFTVCVTEYIPAFATVMEDEVAALLHNREPVKSDAVKTEFSQSLTTLTAGATGISFGTAMPLPAKLLQPFTD